MILDDGRKLVGVRIPITALTTLRAHLAEALLARKIVLEGGAGGEIEPVSPLDQKALLHVKTPPKNIHSYFSRAPSSVPARSSPPTFGKRPPATDATPGSGVVFGGSAGRKRSKGAVVGKGGKENVGSVAKGVAALFGSRAKAVSAGGGVGGGSDGGDVVRPAAVNDGAPEIIAVDD